MTPGAVDPAVHLNEICNGTTKHRRLLSTKICDRMFSAYSIPPGDRYLYECDHDVPIELGGSTARRTYGRSRSPRRKRRIAARRPFVDNLLVTPGSGRTGLQLTQRRIRLGFYEPKMIPHFHPETGYLPAGEHLATWKEVADRFGWNSHRTHLLQGLRRLAAALRDGGCRLLLLDGSFVTDKELPSDFDACADYEGMSPIELVRLRLMGGKDMMKAEYRGEVYSIGSAADDRYDFRAFFQRDVDDVPKGIINLVLDSVP